jgi:hypothetical protein
MSPFISIQCGLGCVGFVSRTFDLGDESLQIIDQEGGMGLARRTKICFDAEMDLHVFRLEPGAAASGKLGRFWDFGEAQKVDKEVSGLFLLARRHGKLYVVNGEDFHGIFNVIASARREAISALRGDCFVTTIAPRNDKLYGSMGYPAFIHA